MAQVSKIPLRKEIEKRVFDLFLEAVGEVKEKSEVSVFLNDLLSPTEQLMLAKRLSIALLLHKGYDQRTICQILKVSLGTVNKVSLLLKLEGEGYRRMIKKVITREKTEEFWQKIDDFLTELAPPKGRNWSNWRRERWIEKQKRHKPF